jgi:hypothetical protein
VSLALPCLDAFAQDAGRPAQPRRRMVCICTPLGLHPPYFFPEKDGADYELTPYLDVLKDFRRDFTVVSGLAHAGQSPGFAHQASASFLTGAQGAGRAGFRNSTSLDVGFPQQAEIFDWVLRNTSQQPPVVDARDVLENPNRTLGQLCQSLGVPFTDDMLAWPPGYRSTDGIWAPHWYTEVVTSTSFQPYRPRTEDVPAKLQSVLKECLDCYERLYEHRLK